MKLSAVAIALTALLIGAVAQSLSGLPSCAQSCVQLPSSCSQLDIKCICSTQTFISAITCCVARTCNQADQETTVKFAQQLCGSAGVSVPSSVVCSSGASSISSASKTSSATVVPGAQATPNTASPNSTSTATNLGSGTTTSATAGSKSSGTSAAAPIAHSKNGGAFAAVGAAAAFVAMLLM